MNLVTRWSLRSRIALLRSRNSRVGQRREVPLNGTDTYYCHGTNLTYNLQMSLGVVDEDEEMRKGHDDSAELESEPSKDDVAPVRVSFSRFKQTV